MALSPAPLRQCLPAELLGNTPVNGEIFQLEFAWTGPAPRGGQFFMIRPRRGSLLLGRPLSVAAWSPAPEEGGRGKLRFLIARRGRGTAELADLRPGEGADLTGPLGTAWTDLLPPGAFSEGKRIALIGGGVGVAPLEALLGELPPGAADFYAGFRTGFQSPEERGAFLGPALHNPGLVIATEDGSEGHRGRIPGFLDPARYGAVCVCGPEPMLKAVALRCGEAGTPCFASLERRMACGAGACLGCTVRTRSGNKRCCADGPVFPAEELIFDE
jgi:NAD(P)H-flavin reductase